jgi:CubicO group peptidase (beta-lactamase class C family)
MRRILALAAALALLSQPAFAAVFEPVAPAEAGFDSARLARLDGFLNAAVAEGRMPGFGVLLARHGRLVSLQSYGKKNLETGETIAPDTIFRVASMTKIVTGVALMMLYEENRFDLDDPVAKFIPEFAHLKVLVGTGPDGKPMLADPVHPPTMRELMSHSGGFGYGTSDDPADKILGAQDAYGAGNLHEFVRRVAKAPLLYQPGTTWRYSAGADISGYIVEKLSGMRFGEFLQRRLFGPLGMKDTAFYVPREKLARLAPVYAGDPATHRFAEVKTSPNPIGLPLVPPTAPPRLDAGGAGLFSTLMDYARFAQMLGNGGALDTAIGFGLDAQVMLDPRAAGSLVGKNTMSWHGAFAGWWWVDPTNDIVCVGMAQRSGIYPDYVFDDIDQVQKLVHQALVHPER